MFRLVENVASRKDGQSLTWVESEAQTEPVFSIEATES